MMIFIMKKMDVVQCCSFTRKLYMLSGFVCIYANHVYMAHILCIVLWLVLI